MKNEEIKEIAVAGGVAAACVAALGALFTSLMALGLVFSLIKHAFRGVLLYFAWNCAAVPLFGMAVVTYPQAVALSFLVGLLRGIFNFGSSVNVTQPASPAYVETKRVN